MVHQPNEACSTPAVQSAAVYIFCFERAHSWYRRFTLRISIGTIMLCALKTSSTDGLRAWGEDGPLEEGPLSTGSLSRPMRGLGLDLS